MEAAVQGGIDEIEAQCGGACACATCHVYIPDDWRSITGEANEMERELLDAADAVTPNSRLSCQIELKGNMDGLVVELPPSSASA
jgi:2Fe-2S ferredoxin